MKTTHFLAIGPHCWGRGTDMATAIKNASKNWPREYHRIKRPRREHFTVYSSETEIEINDLGHLRSDSPMTRIQLSTL